MVPLYFCGMKLHGVKLGETQHSEDFAEVF